MNETFSSLSIPFVAEESPPKKPKLDIQQSSDNEIPKCSNSIEPDIKIDNGASSTKNQSDEESKDHQQCSSSLSPTFSSRNDLIRDIESHIEIIFECFDVDDSISTNAAAKTETSSAESSNEIITSSEASHEMVEKTSSEKAEDTENEKKNEISSD